MKTWHDLCFTVTLLLGGRPRWRLRWSSGGQWVKQHLWYNSTVINFLIPMATILWLLHDKWCVAFMIEYHEVRKEHANKYEEAFIKTNNSSSKYYVMIVRCTSWSNLCYRLMVQYRWLLAGTHYLSYFYPSSCCIWREHILNIYMSVLLSLQWQVFMWHKELSERDSLCYHLISGLDTYCAITTGLIWQYMTFNHSGSDCLLLAWQGGALYVKQCVYHEARLTRTQSVIFFHMNYINVHGCKIKNDSKTYNSAGLIG